MCLGLGNLGEGGVLFFGRGGGASHCIVFFIWWGFFLGVLHGVGVGGGMHMYVWMFRQGWVRGGWKCK